MGFVKHQARLSMESETVKAGENVNESDNGSASAGAVLGSGDESPVRNGDEVCPINLGSSGDIEGIIGHFVVSIEECHAAIRRLTGRRSNSEPIGQSAGSTQ